MKMPKTSSENSNEKAISSNGFPAKNSHCDEDLRKRLVEEDQFLTRLIDTIPAKMYFDHDIQEKITAEKHTAMDKTAEELKRKFTINELSVKNKRKRARLDPCYQKSVSQIQQEMEQQKKKKNKRKGQFPSATLVRAVGIEELQKKLQERIEQFQSKRKGTTPIDVLEKKRLKKKMKNLKRRQKGNLTKQSLAISKSENHNLPKIVKAEKTLPSKPVFNKEGKIIFSKFDFSESGHTNGDQTANAKKDSLAGKNYKKLLYKAEKRKEKIEQLKETDAEKAEILGEKDAWKKAILKTEGIKVKDDLALLKKSMKKQQKQKGKSSKVWKERKEQTEKRMKDRQDKRMKNIKARKQDKLDHKIKRAKKKGRVIPGF